MEVHDLTIPDEAWRNGSVERSHLVVTLAINGILHHLEAVRVVAENGMQRAFDPAYEYMLDAIAMNMCDGPFETVTIAGGTYVLFATPFH